MITVFVILGLVVLTGDLLIRVVNRYFPAASIKSPLGRADQQVSNTSNTSAMNDKSTVAAIVAAVDIITAGKGNAASIEKIN